MALRYPSFLLLIAAGASAASAQQAPRGLQLHGNAFVAFLDQSTMRGGSGLQSTAWLMSTYTHGFGTADVDGRLMVTLDPVTLGDCGYARLAIGQLGMCDDRPFEDRVHAHPLLMDVSAGAALQISGATLRVRAGLVGEPALGPTSYLHRAAAQLDPAVPLTSFDLNPAHIANGFTTAAITYGRVSLELSAFNSEPGDDNQYDLDPGALESLSGRVWLLLGNAHRVQISAGELASFDAGSHAAHGGVSGPLRIVTSSLESEYSVRGMPLHTTLAWGRQRLGGLTTDALLAEALLQRGRFALSARAESLESIEARQFVVILPDGSHEHDVTHRVIRNHEIGGTLSTHLIDLFGMQARAGMRGTLTFFPASREDYYGDRRAHGLAAFINLQPARSVAHQH
jgi:hypothetical protein